MEELTKKEKLPNLDNIIWKPLEGENGRPSSQQLALSAPCNEILYEGTRGCGKTEVQLIRFLQRVGKGYGSYWTGILFDRGYKQLNEVIERSKKLFAHTNGTFLSSNNSLCWSWPTGEKLYFRHISCLADYDNYHGHEYPWIGWNELTKSPTPELYEIMMSCNRHSFDPEEHSPRLTPNEVDLYKEIRKKTGNKGRLTIQQKRWLQNKSSTIFQNTVPPMPLEVFSTTNPWGVGHNWVKNRFIDVADAGQIVKRKSRIYNPKTQEKEYVVRTQVRIFGSWTENKYLSPEYIASLSEGGNPDRMRAWLQGDWSITSGGAFDDLWTSKVIQPFFTIPKNWDVFRSMDWGSSKPFSVGWWAISNGEEVEVRRGSKVNKVSYPKGSMIRISEWYGTEAIGTNKGLLMGSKEVAQGIKQREETLTELGYLEGFVRAGPADNSIWSSDDKSVPCVGDIMKKEGVTWTESNKTKGSRANGLEVCRTFMKATKTGEGAGVYCFNECQGFIQTIKILPRDEKNPDDVETDAEDHIYDEWRYSALDNKPPSVKTLKNGAFAI